MNIHPIFVHFPIAFLTFYALAELIRFRRLNDTATWLYLKFSFLLIGVAGLFVALQTGDIAKQFHRDVRQLVSLHETYAQITTIIFALLLCNYILIIGDSYAKKLLPTFLYKLWNVVNKIRRVIFSTPVVIILALVGLVTLTIAGALGGIIVYGSGLDPVTTFVGKLLLGH